MPPPRPDAVVKLRTPRRTFTLALEVKRTYLDQVLTNAIIAEHRAMLERHRLPLLLAARYIPPPTGERLAEAGVNFVDRPGNVHLALGDDHHVLLLGRREPAREPTARRVGPALVQLLFALLAEPAAAAWPIRPLAEAAGIGKTAAATGRERLVRLGILAGGRRRPCRVVDHDRLVDEFLGGYANVLRPHLLIGRFRTTERDPDRLIRGVAAAAERAEVPVALTGSAGAYALDRFYRGEEITLLVGAFTPALQRSLRLVPDREGPVTLLRAFGTRWAWRATGGVTVAHPWLIYAELLCQGDPRGLEAAEQMRHNYLTGV
ncbi:MAG TPA: type IV toxin-antitoxin system AbiEi family antitoxin [Thermodesulfobacteriota bacterium]